MEKIRQFIKQWKWVFFLVLIYGTAIYLVLNGVNWR